MKKYKKYKKRSKLPNRVKLVVFAIILVAIFGTILVRNIYNAGLGPVSKSQTTQIFIVDSGSTVRQISSKLEKEKLIKSAWAMELYIHSKDLSDKLQAGTYAFSPNQGTASIVKTMNRGDTSKRLIVILPGRRIDQIRADFINQGFSPVSVDAALRPSNYSGLAILAFKPSSVNSLEGLLWPESFQKDSTTTPEMIIRQSLQMMGRQITPEVQASFASQGLTVYQGLTLASIITQEVSKAADQTQVSQVFLTRLKTDMALGSDVTAVYGSVTAGYAPSLTYDSPYNTHYHKGLPPTPISNVTASALYAASHPTSTGWLFFVTGDDGTTYFSTNLKDHQAYVDKYCHKLCGR